MAKSENRRVNLWLNTKDSEDNLKSLRAESAKLRNEINLMEQGSDDFVNATRRYREVQKRIKNINEDIRGTNTAMSKMKKSFKDFGVFAAANIASEVIVNAFGSVVDSIKSLVTSNAELSDQFADIQKTTGMTAKEVKELNKQLKELDTRTSGADLRGIAKIGGQLGIAKKDLLGFVESVDKAVVALGDEFTGGAEEVSKQLGKMQKLFKETKNLKAGDAINKIGSAINALGSAGSATAPEMAEFTKRIGQLGDLAPQIDQTLGLAAAMEELGMTAEVSSGGITNLFVTAGKESAAFAQQLNMSVTEFKELLNNNPNEMLLKLAESMKGASNTKIIETLNRLKIGSQESIKVMSLLANQTDFVREKQKLARIEMDKATSLTNEFNLKNNNLAGTLAKIQKRLTGMFINSKMMEGIERMVFGFAKLLEIPLSKKLEKERVAFNKLAAEMLSANTKTEDRKKLIEKLQELNPSFLEGQELEKLSMNDLAAAVRKVNDQYLNKILLEERQEEINAIKEESAKRKVRAAELQVKVDEKLLALENAKMIQLDRTKSKVEQVEQALAQLAKKSEGKLESRRLGIREGSTVQKELLEMFIEVSKEETKKAEELDKKIENLKSEREKIAEKLGIKLTTEENTTTIPQKGDGEPTGEEGGGGTPTTVVPPKEDPIAKLKAEQEKILEQVKAFEEEKQQAEWLAHEEGLEQARQMSEERQAMRDEIYLMGLDEQARELADIDLHYQALIDKANELGLEREEIWKLQNLKNLAIQKAADQQELDNAEKLGQAKAQLLQQNLQLLSSIIGVAQQMSADDAEFQKILTLFQIAVDTASAISSATAKNAQTSPEPISYAIKVATQIGMIMGNMMKAKQLLTKEPPAAPSRSFFFGGFTGQKGLGMGDKHGEFTGAVHKDEYVVPSFLMRDPLVADFVGMIEAKRTKQAPTGFFEGGPTSPSASTTTVASTTNKTNFDMLAMEMRGIREDMQNWKTNIKSFIVFEDLEDTEEEVQNIRQASNL